MYLYIILFLVIIIISIYFIYNHYESFHPHFKPHFKNRVYRPYNYYYYDYPYNYSYDIPVKYGYCEFDNNKNIKYNGCKKPYEPITNIKNECACSNPIDKNDYGCLNNSYRYC